MQRFCEECHDLVNFTERLEPKEKVIKGKLINYLGKEAYCNVCESKIFVSEIRDYNLEQLDAAYREHESLIKVSEMEQILKQYNIGKRPLSNILGWGEGTLTRYLNGDIPTKQYSDILLSIKDDYHLLEGLLEENSDKITDTAYRNCIEAIGGMKADKKPTLIDESNSKIDYIVEYLIGKSADITPLALQKLLYYSQAFHKVFYGEYLFKEDCEAWVHGPVYREVYSQYKSYGFNPIDEEVLPESTPTLSISEKELLDSVVLNLGCYSGKILEYMTHIESPWIQTRKGLNDNEACTESISKDLISDYFTEIKSKYNMLNVFDIKDYSDDLFSKVKLKG